MICGCINYFTGSSVRHLALLLTTALLSLPGTAALAQSQPPADTVEDITVVAAPVRDAVQAFVDTVGEAPPDRNLARWDRTICVGVVNLAPRYAQALADQVSAVAMAVGLEPGEPGCRPDVLILADSNGDNLARWMVGQQRRAFRPDLSASNLGSAALERFQTSGAPVRWWHVSQAVSADTGEAIGSGETVRVRGASRLRGNIREDLHHIIIILDTSRIGSISFASLADYVAMVALAQVDADAEVTSYDTVLNLFAPNSVPGQRMTDWDLDYLRGLYAARPDALSETRQQREIADEVVRQRALRQEQAESGAPATNDASEAPVADPAPEAGSPPQT